MEKQHYSDKGGHFKRSQISKVLRSAEEQGLVVCKSEVTYCMRRFAKRVPRDGKR